MNSFEFSQYQKNFILEQPSYKWSRCIRSCLLILAFVLFFGISHYYENIPNLVRNISGLLIILYVVYEYVQCVVMAIIYASVKIASIPIEENIEEGEVLNITELKSLEKLLSSRKKVIASVVSYTPIFHLNHMAKVIHVASIMLDIALLALLVVVGGNYLMLAAAHLITIFIILWLLFLIKKNAVIQIKKLGPKEEEEEEELDDLSNRLFHDRDLL